MRQFFSVFIPSVVLLSTVAAQSFPGRIGVEVSDQPTAFVDAAKILRQFQLASNGAPAPHDANGWPTSDAYTVLFDYRKSAAWATPADRRPHRVSPDMSGTYKLSFNGQATVTFRDTTAGAALTHQSYDAATNTTTADLTIPFRRAVPDRAELRRHHPDSRRRHEHRHHQSEMHPARLPGESDLRHGIRQFARAFQLHALHGLARDELQRGVLRRLRPPHHRMG